MNTGAITRHTMDSLDLRRLLGLLLDHKWLIIFLTLIFTLVGIAYALLATPIYRGDALVQVERRSSVSPLGDLANVMGDTGYAADSSTAAEVQILQSRMVLSQVVERTGLDTAVVPNSLPLVGNFVQRKEIPRPGFATETFRMSEWLPSTIALPEAVRSHPATPEALKGGISLPESLTEWLSLPAFLRGYSAVWGGESLRLGRFEVADSLRGIPLVLKVLSDNTYAVTQLGEEPQELGEGVVGELGSFSDGELLLRVADLRAAPGAEFSLIKHTLPTAVRSLSQRLSVNEVSSARTASTGMLRLSLTGTNPEEIRSTLDSVAEIFLTQNVQRQSAEAEKSLAFLEDQAPELRTQLAAAEESLNQYRVEQDSVDLTSEAQATVQQFIDLESRLSELQLEEEALAQRYTTNHPSYQSLLRQKRQLQEERERLNARVDELPAAQQEVVRRTRDVEVTQAIYLNVLNKMQELEVARAGTVGNVRIIDSALVEEFPIEPRKPLVVLLAMILGALVSVAIVLLRGFLNRGIEAPEQLEDAGLPVYATIPLSSEQKKLVKRVKHRRERHSREVTADVLMARAPSDTTAEAVRGLRTSLHFAMLDSADNRLMITGPSPGIGKSFIAVNLGAACAQAGQKVLVIDADMRKGHLHHAFAGSSSPGLSELLGGGHDRHEVIRASGIEGLDYVSRGTAPPNPSELLMTSGFSLFLEQVSESYDLVILDTPPVLAVTDASIISAQCGTSLLVARHRQNPVRELINASRRLESGGGKVKGVILNAMEKTAVANYGYGYYQYSY